ncbi:MAG: GNAT family N-acetyltransferase [Deltaproteobacteria bacterium]|nr:GNAT family N-acetyltransferase [Deltaproteobacteria bacterium]
MILVSLAANDPRIDAFWYGLYWDAFSAQHEPLASWHAALRGRAAYELHIDLALDGEAIAGGIVYERYPRTGCGLVTYMTVATAHRRHGLGERLLKAAATSLYERGAPFVLGEVNDPERATHEHAAEASARLRRFQRWDARVIDVRYVQPALGEDLVRDRDLVLLVLPPVPPTISGITLRAFLDEFYEATERTPPDPEISVPDIIRLVER